MANISCCVCKEPLDSVNAYEYRGAYGCAEHIDEVERARDRERSEVIAEERQKTDAFRGLDLSPDSVVGKANRKLLKRQAEIASRESARLRNYEASGASSISEGSTNNTPKD